MSAKVLVSTANMPYEDWLEYRRRGIGGSDASVVCGVSRYKSPVELWLDKTGQLPAQEAGEAAYWGTQLESLVRAEFIKRTGIEVRQVKQLLQSEEHPFMLANLKRQPLSLDLFDVVKSPSGGSTVFTVPGLGGDEAEKELTGIILDYTMPRAYRDTPDPVEGTPPV